MAKHAAPDGDPPAAADELWTTGQAAAYLSDLGITRRQVSRLIDSGELAGFRTGQHRWARVPARVVRAYREGIEARRTPG